MIGKNMLALACCLVATSAADWARADIAAKDAQVIGRVLGFLENPPTGTVELGIVFDPARSESVAEAEKLRIILGDGLTSGKARIKPRLVAIADIIGTHSVVAFFVTRGLGDGVDAVADAARQRHVPTITNDPACTYSGRCVISATTEPTVEIVVNKAAAEATGTKFATFFRMLIKEI
jgi:hypothetical protein